MPTRAIACTNCGIKGEIEVRGLSSGVSPAKMFRHLGHNPFSGHMHYQCPACEIVLLVDPMAILADDGTIILHSRGKQKTAGMRHTAGAPG
ncbi:MAG: hypothetical protein HY742_01615 [Deltaproteobacteria bacterium]|nr:hypothetical protein [Deltaproteobacteria bacterium]